MNIAPYWSRCRLDPDGHPSDDGVAVAFGWSFTSQAEAEAHARARAERVAERLRRLRSGDDAALDDLEEGALSLGPDEEPGWDYYGTSRPVREPILERYGHDEPREEAMIAYGCELLGIERGAAPKG